LHKDANFNPYWSHAQDQLPHFSALLSPFPGPKHSLFPPSIHTGEHFLTMTTSTYQILLLLGTIIYRTLLKKSFGNTFFARYVLERKKL
jgi:hypothetical protein